MTVESVMDLAQKTMSTAIEISLPVLVMGMAVGIGVAIMQAATQIQEASLAFVPKLIGMGVALVMFGPWILNKLTGFAITLISSMAHVGG